MKLPIPADWDGESWCKWAVCWPDSEGWEAILRGFVTLPQRGWTWDERTGSILAVQATGQEITAANLPLNGVFMACNDTQLTAAFSEIALALRYLADKQCCDNLQIDVNGGFQGTIISPEGVSVPIFGSQPPLAPEPGTFPEEFETEEEYNLSKCQVANGIADGLIAALRAFSNISIAQFTLGLVLTVLAFAGAIVFPPAGFPALMIALGILGGSTGLLYVMANKLEENRPELVCLLYTGDSTSSIIGAIADFFDILIASIPGVGALGLAIKTVLLVLINSDTVNQLFNSSVAYVYPSADCAGCGPAWSIATGELLSGDLAGEFEVTSAEVAAGQGWIDAPHRQEIQLFIPGNAEPCQQTTITVSNWTDGGFGEDGHPWSYYDCNGVYTYGFGSPGAALIDICFGPGRVLLLGHVDFPFTATITASEDCVGGE